MAEVDPKPAPEATPKPKRRSGKVPARSAEKMEKKLRLSALFLNGMTNTVVLAKEIGVEPSYIGDLLRELKSEWADRLDQNGMAFINEEIARLDMLIFEATTAWQLSLKEKTTSTTERETKAIGEGEMTTTKVRMEKTSGTGDVRLLDQINKLIATKMELVGVKKLQSPVLAFANQTGTGRDRDNELNPDDLAALPDEELLKLAGIDPSEVVRA
jgi:hypothetical protein